MNDEKIYINSMTFKEHKFQNGGSVLNVGINVDKIIEELGNHKNDKGYMNISIQKRREPDQYGRTHYAVLNTYNKNNDSQETQASTQVQAQDDFPDDDIPF